ncbi:MAG: Fic family protein [Hyphomonadaceae bacterium]|nr:Fic family protein [Hyphomonadaceae bacterium]
MKSFEPAYLASLAVSHRAIRTVAALTEYRGKQKLWAEAKREVLEHLLKVAMIESVESSSRLEQIVVGNHTLDRLLVNDEAPAAENRSQAELAGYRDAIKLIHENATDMPITEGIVRQLHSQLMKYTPAGGGNYKFAPNDIVEKSPDGRILRVRFRTVQPIAVETYMAGLHEGYRTALEEGEIEPLILVPLYVHDLLCIHPFSDGNGRIARLMSVLLLRKLGYDVGRYISLERIIEESKVTYYSSLGLSDVGWYEGRHDHAPFTEYMLGVALSAYRELEANTSLDFSHGAKKVIAEEAIEALPITFRFADVAAKAPLIKESTIKATLKKMREDGRIVSEGRGRGAYWRKVGPTSSTS